MTAGFTSSPAPCLVCAMQHTNGGENEREATMERDKGEGSKVEGMGGRRESGRGGRREREGVGRGKQE